MFRPGTEPQSRSPRSDYGLSRASLGTQKNPKELPPFSLNGYEIWVSRKFPKNCLSETLQTWRRPGPAHNLGEMGAVAAIISENMRDSAAELIFTGIKGEGL